MPFQDDVRENHRGEWGIDTVALMSGGLTPEQKARVEIEKKLATAGWLVQDVDQIDLAAGPSVAVRGSDRERRCRLSPLRREGDPRDLGS